VQPEVEAYVNSLTDNRIKLFRLEQNSGLATALNFLLQLVLKNPEYKFIARMDADDISMPLRFEKQRTYLLAKPDITVLGCWYEEIDESGRHLSYRRLPTDHESLRKRYFTRTPFAHSSVMYRRDLIEKAGFYSTDTNLMEDNVLWGRALKGGLRVANIPDYLSKFRIDKDYYKRRSGLKYGWNYIQKKARVNKSLNAPLYLLPILFIQGVLKMLPGFCLKQFYRLRKK